MLLLRLSPITKICSSGTVHFLFRGIRLISSFDVGLIQKLAVAVHLVILKLKLISWLTDHPFDPYMLIIAAKNKLSKGLSIKSFLKVLLHINPESIMTISS